MCDQLMPNSLIGTGRCHRGLRHEPQAQEAWGLCHDKVGV